MNDFGVKEAQCTRCGHREVCSLKTEFLEAQKAIDEVYVSRPCEDGKKVGMISISTTLPKSLGMLLGILQ